jgi:hypothetical protein
MLDVTADDLGLWLAGSEYRNWIEFSIAVVDLAIEYGRPVDSDSWESDKAILLAGVGYYDSLDYLNNNLPKDYFFYVTDGLYLVYNKES